MQIKHVSKDDPWSKSGGRNAGRDPTMERLARIQSAEGWSKGLHKGERSLPLLVVRLRKTGRGFQRGYDMPLGRWGAGESEVFPRVMKRRNVSLVQKGSMPGCAKTERDATGERLASPLPRECCSTTHILRSFLSALFLHILS